MLMERIYVLIKILSRPFIIWVPNWIDFLPLYAQGEALISSSWFGISSYLYKGEWVCVCRSPKGVSAEPELHPRLKNMAIFCNIFCRLLKMLEKLALTCSARLTPEDVHSMIGDWSGLFGPTQALTKAFRHRPLCPPHHLLKKFIGIIKQTRGC